MLTSAISKSLSPDGSRKSILTAILGIVGWMISGPLVSTVFAAGPDDAYLPPSIVELKKPATKQYGTP